MKRSWFFIVVVMGVAAASCKQNRSRGSWLRDDNDYLVLRVVDSVGGSDHLDEVEELRIYDSPESSVWVSEETMIRKGVGHVRVRRRENIHLVINGIRFSDFGKAGSMQGVSDVYVVVIEFREGQVGYLRIVTAGGKWYVRGRDFIHAIPEPKRIGALFNDIG